MTIQITSSPFSGSMNESANAFITNYEAIDVFTSWTKDEDRVLIKQSAFDAMWNDYEPSIRVMIFPKLVMPLLKDTGQQTLSILRLRKNFSQKKEHILKSHYEERMIGPQIPKYVHMRPYQIDAINAWTNNNYKGIFDMATGTGKTYTALAAIEQLFRDKGGNLAVIIICPYQHLVEQWKEDIVSFGMKPIVCYSSSYQKNWRERLKTAITSFNIGVIKHFCIVSTNATFSLDYVQSEIQKLMKCCISC